MKLISQSNATIVSHIINDCNQQDEKLWLVTLDLNIFLYLNSSIGIETFKVGVMVGIKYKPLFKKWLSRFLICEIQMNSYIHKLKSYTTTYLDHEYVSLTTSFSSKSSTCSKSLIHIIVEPSDVRGEVHIPQQVKFLDQLLFQNHKLYQCKPTLE
jgi:hypothetical protein